jgi:hypothetical protein
MPTRLLMVLARRRAVSEATSSPARRAALCTMPSKRSTTPLRWQLLTPAVLALRRRPRLVAAAAAVRPVVAAGGRVADLAAAVDVAEDVARLELGELDPKSRTDYTASHLL